MSTVPLRCPKCGAWLRVAVQPSSIDVEEESLFVYFDSQTVAHTCKEEKK